MPPIFESDLGITLSRQRISFFQHGCEHTRSRSRVALMSTDDHVCQTRMDRQIVHRTAVCGDLTRIIQGAERSEQGTCLLHIRRWRWIEKPERCSLRISPSCKIQCHVHQVRLLDLGSGVGRKVVVFGFSPQAVAIARCLTPCATASLVGSCL